MSDQQKPATANTRKTDANLRPWKKGQSGNPSGRPAVPVEIKARLKELLPEALEVLATLLHSADEKVALAAANSILDRNLGKPVSAADIDEREQDELSRMTEAQLWEIVNQGKAS